MSMENSRFDMQAFQFPGIRYAPVYAWVWNSACTVEIIDEQLAEMARLGIRAFYIIPEPKEFRPHTLPTDLSPDYLTPEYLSLYAYAMEKGRELGMRCWLYDEGGWPSGGACGKVLADHPEYAKEVLSAKEHSFPAGSLYVPKDPETLAAFLPDGTQIAEGYAFPQDTIVTEYRTVLVNHGGSDYPDLLNKDAMEYFLEITHERYASVLQSALGRNITAVFTDEPKAPVGAFRQELAEQYENLYGESILSSLPLLAGKTPVTEENIHILYRWYDLCSRMFCDHFLRPCKAWSNAHGMAFTGHMDVEHDPVGCLRGGNYHLMRALRCLDIPGVDLIWRQIYPESEDNTNPDRVGYNGFFPRYASSAAAQIGADSVMTESFGVFGPGLTFDLMRYCLGYQAVRGINILNPMLISLSRKNVQLAQELPSFTEDQIYHKDLPIFNRFMERLSYLTTLGERVCDTALYYPIHDFWGRINRDAAAGTFDALGRAMENRQVDFDIVDDDVLQAADGVEEGYIRMGKAAYRHIVIPANAYLPAETVCILERFVKAGGKVSNTEKEAVPAVQTDGSADGLRVMRRKSETGEVLCLFRETGDTDFYTIHVPSGNVYRMFAENGHVQKMTVCDGMVQVSLRIGETAVLMITEDKLSAQPEENFCETYTLQDAFRFRRTLGLAYGTEKLENIVYQEDAVPLALGDWASLVGSAYSGSGIYRTVFRPVPDAVEKACVLDLGDVRYTASVTLNGQPLGTILMPPYRFSMPAGLLREENTLEITVTNTPGNAFVHTDFFDKWETWQLSPYYEKELKFSKDSAFGGLYGPVKVLYNK